VLGLCVNSEITLTFRDICLHAYPCPKWTVISVPTEKLGKHLKGKKGAQLFPVLQVFE
jgi:hypothetical protein